MSATTFSHRQPRTGMQAHAARKPQPQTTSDHGYLIKVVAGVLLVTVTVAIVAPLGWAILPAALAILAATTAGVLHATLRLLDRTDQEDR